MFSNKTQVKHHTANLLTKILDFRGFDSGRILSSQAHREFPGKFESSNLRRDNLSRRLGVIRMPNLGGPDPAVVGISSMGASLLKACTNAFLRTASF